MKSKTVTEQILSDCRRALYNGKPIIVIRTNEMNIIREIVESDRLVVRLTKDVSRGQQNITVKPTRECNKSVNTQLFRASSDIVTENFNIHYIQSGNGQLASATAESYGTMKYSEKYTFPSMYIVQHSTFDDGHHLEMWKKLDINAFIDRFIQERANGGALSSSVVLVFGEDAAVPRAYENYCEIIDEPYPAIDEIKACLCESGCFDDGDDASMTAVADALLGLRIYEIKNLVRCLSVMPREEGGGCVLNDEMSARKEISIYKKQVLKKSNLLELVETPDEIADITGEDSPIGGMGEFTEWIKNQKQSIKNGARLKRETGAMPPKGVLLCGIPGCGKSMAADCVARTLGIPLLKLDIGQLMGSYVGQSEHNMARALKVAEAMSPCVLFIDELDKGFSGAAGRGDDSGPFKRMFGTLLAWMQSCKKPCFIFATANDISALPKEFFRSGRFDCLYSLYMPTADECVDIFIKQMKQAEKNTDTKALFTADCYRKDSLRALITEFGTKERFVTGADIAKLIGMSLRRIWCNEGIDKISWNKWRENILLSLEETTVYGDSKENMDSIAICYIRLLRSNFIPACDNPVFTKEDYKPIEKECDDKNNREIPEYEIKVKDKTMVSIYDNKMREKLKPLIEKYGKVIETNSLRRMTE